MILSWQEYLEHNARARLIGPPRYPYARDEQSLSLADVEVTLFSAEEDSAAVEAMESLQAEVIGQRLLGLEPAPLPEIEFEVDEAELEEVIDVDDSEIEEVA